MKRIPEELKTKNTIYTEHWRAKHPEHAAALVQASNSRQQGRRILARAMHRSAYWRNGITKRLAEGMSPIDIAIELHVPLSAIEQIRTHGRLHLP